MITDTNQIIDFISSTADYPKITKGKLLNDWKNKPDFVIIETQNLKLLVIIEENGTYTIIEHNSENSKKNKGIIISNFNFTKQ